MAALEEKLAEAVRQFPVLYDKSCRDFKDNSKKRLAWEDVAKQVGLQTGMYCSSEYRFICLMFSLVRIMAAVFSGFSVWVLITVVWLQFSYAESEAYDSASVVPIHTRSELSSDSVSAYDSASVASVASVNQP